MKLIIRILVTIGIFLMSSMALQAQLMKKIGDAAKGAAENATIRKTEQKTDNAVSKSIDKATDPNSYKGNEKGGNKATNNKNSNNQPSDADDDNDNVPAVKGQASSAANTSKQLEMAYAKSDFVPGDIIIFFDDLANEKMGEFPSQWDLIHGNAEIAKINGENVISFVEATTLEPLMKNQHNYLTDAFTIELDFFIPQEHFYGARYYKILNEQNQEVVRIGQWYGSDELPNQSFTCEWLSTAGDRRNSEAKWTFTSGWHHLAISFNKRALKVYVDGTRIINTPNVAQGNFFQLTTYSNEKPMFFKNFRIAKGAVPLYDRMMTDGKIITYGITFDVGKSTIKPESMSEINRIVTLMKENPDLKFSVEGHTDNTGSAAANQKLSDERSAAVVAKLVELGISKDRLKSAGKGQTSPIADNSTDEGRAKNRRVEFVKIN